MEKPTPLQLKQQKIAQYENSLKGIETYLTKNPNSTFMWGQHAKVMEKLEKVKAFEINGDS